MPIQCLLDLVDREMKTEFNVVLDTKEINGGFRVKTLITQAGELPLIPDWSLSYTGTPGSGSALLPAYIVTEDLIEYHWLSDPNPRVFQLGVPGSLASQYVVVKFGAPVVKMTSAGAHFQVIVQTVDGARWHARIVHIAAGFHYRKPAVLFEIGREWRLLEPLPEDTLWDTCCRPTMRLMVFRRIQQTIGSRWLRP